MPIITINVCATKHCLDHYWAAPDALGILPAHGVNSVCDACGGRADVSVVLPLGRTAERRGSLSDTITPVS